MLGNIGRRMLRKPWSLALVGGLVVLLVAAFLLAQVGEGSLFGIAF